MKGGGHVLLTGAGSARYLDNPANDLLYIAHEQDELSHYSTFDYVIINDEIDRAAGQLESIIYAERARCMRQEGLVRAVIEKFKSNSITDS